MLIKEIYKNVHTLLAKDGNEGLISMDRWNTLLESWNHEFIRSKLEEEFTITPNGMAIPKAKFSTKLMDNFIRTTPLTGTVEGSDRYFTITGSALFMYWLSANTTAAYNGSFREIELVSDAEYRHRRANMLSKPISENPVICQRIGRFYIYPSDITAISVSYIKIPTTPFQDYYMDANYQLQLMGATTSHILTSGEQYRDGSTTGTKVSTTVELEIPEGMHPAFQQYIIESLQGTLGDLNAQQISMAKKQMEEAK